MQSPEESDSSPGTEVMDPTMWVMGIQPKSSARAASANKIINNNNYVTNLFSSVVGSWVLAIYLIYIEDVSKTKHRILTRIEPNI